MDIDQILDQGDVYGSELPIGTFCVDQSHQAFDRSKSFGGGHIHAQCKARIGGQVQPGHQHEDFGELLLVDLAIVGIGHIDHDFDVGDLECFAHVADGHELLLFLVFVEGLCRRLQYLRKFDVAALEQVLQYDSASALKRNLDRLDLFVFLASGEVDDVFDCGDRRIRYHHRICEGGAINELFAGERQAVFSTSEQ